MRASPNKPHLPAICFLCHICCRINIALCDDSRIMNSLTRNIVRLITILFGDSRRMKWLEKCRDFLAEVRHRCFDT